MAASMALKPAIGYRVGSAHRLVVVPADNLEAVGLAKPSIATCWRLSLSLSAPTLVADEVRM
jgi:hypothetical protein